MDSIAPVAALAEHMLAERFDAVAQLFVDANATLYKFLWGPPADAVGVSELQFLLNYWTGLGGPQALPRLEQITPFDMRPALGYVVLIDALDQAWDGRYRLYGSRVAERTGVDMTGRRISELGTGTAGYLTLFARALYRAVHVARRPALISYRPPVDQSATAWRWLVMPLTDAEGAVVRFLTGEFPV
jgi:hypothetical protein